MASSRVRRGRKTQQHAAEYMREFGFYWAESVTGAETGTDIKGVPGWDIEVKATSDGPLLGAIRQQAKRLEGTALVNGFVVWRPDGYGPEKIGDWVVAMPFKEWMRHMCELEFPEAEALPAEDVRELPDGERVRQAINTLNDWLNAHN